VRTLHWTFGQSDLDTRATVQVLVAGFGAMALFRSRLFTVARPSATDGEVTFLWSPSTVLEGVLKIADREARKSQGRSRLRALRTMQHLTWKETRELPPIVLAIMAGDTDHVADEERAVEFAADIAALEKNPEGYSENQLKLMLGVRVVRFAGVQVLQEAIACVKRGATVV
jgi:hypothetical protein